MPARYLGLCLATATMATAQETAPPPVTADDMRALLQDPNGDLSRLAQGMIGKNGGNQLFYFPSRDEPSTPAAWGLEFEPIHFKSGDGTPLHGWFIPAKGKTAKTAKGTVVFSHGNAGSISYHLGFCAWLAEASYNVIIYDYRGFGKSDGELPSEESAYEDTRAAWAELTRRVPQSKRYIYGPPANNLSPPPTLRNVPSYVKWDAMVAYDQPMYTLALNFINPRRIDKFDRLL